MKIEYLKSPNFEQVKRRNIKYIIIHYTGMKTAQESIKRLRSKKHKVSSHYFINERGKITQANATKGEKVLLKVLDSDEGARRLGEVALVPDNSPISQTGLLFYNTLFDENAACHIALGQCYTKCFKNQNLTKEEISSQGGNSSMIHIDWMIGSNQIDIDGIKQNGDITPIFRKGKWAQKFN